MIFHPVDPFTLFPEEDPDIVLKERLDENGTLSISCVAHQDPSQIQRITIGANCKYGILKLFAFQGIPR